MKIVLISKCSTFIIFEITKNVGKRFIEKTGKTNIKSK